MVLVDRIAIALGLHQRLIDSIEICYREAGEVIFEGAAGGPGNGSEHAGSTLRFNEKFQCKTCGLEFAQPEPVLFSFNSPAGACPRCQGFGNTIDFDMDRVIPDRSLSLEAGAVEPWTKPKFRSWLGNFRKSAKGRVRFTVPFCDLTAPSRKPSSSSSAASSTTRNQEIQTARARLPEPLSRLRAVPGVPRRTPAQGSPLRPRGRPDVAEILRMNIAEAGQFFDSLELSAEEAPSPTNPGGDPPTLEIPQRRGLDYLTLDRLSATLSGGEANASSSPPPWGRGWWAPVTCSTSLPSGCTAATPAG